MERDGSFGIVWEWCRWFGMVWGLGGSFGLQAQPERVMGNSRLAGGGGGLVWDGLGLVWMVWARLGLFGPVRTAMVATQ